MRPTQNLVLATADLRPPEPRINSLETPLPRPRFKVQGNHVNEVGHLGQAMLAAVVFISKQGRGQHLRGTLGEVYGGSLQLVISFGI